MFPYSGFAHSNVRLTEQFEVYCAYGVEPPEHHFKMSLIPFFDPVSWVPRKPPDRFFIVVISWHLHMRSRRPFMVSLNRCFTKYSSPSSFQCKLLVQTSPCGEVWFEIWLKAHGKIEITRGAAECDFKFFPFALKARVMFALKMVQITRS